LRHEPRWRAELRGSMCLSNRKVRQRTDARSSGFYHEGNGTGYKPGPPCGAAL